MNLLNKNRRILGYLDQIKPGFFFREDRDGHIRGIKEILVRDGPVVVTIDMYLVRIKQDNFENALKI